MKSLDSRTLKRQHTGLDFLGHNPTSLGTKGRTLDCLALAEMPSRMGKEFQELLPVSILFTHWLS